MQALVWMGDGTWSIADLSTGVEGTDPKQRLGGSDGGGEDMV
jgi:hypothetical protein